MKIRFDRHLVVNDWPQMIPCSVVSQLCRNFPIYSKLSQPLLYASDPDANKYIISSQMPSYFGHLQSECCVRSKCLLAHGNLQNVFNKQLHIFDLIKNGLDFYHPHSSKRKYITFDGLIRYTQSSNLYIQVSLEDKFMPSGSWSPVFAPLILLVTNVEILSL